MKPIERINRLQAILLAEKKPLVIVIYADGTRKSMKWMDAFLAIGSGEDITDVQCEDLTGESLLEAMLPGSENGDNIWADLPEVE